MNRDTCLEMQSHYHKHQQRNSQPKIHIKIITIAANFRTYQTGRQVVKYIQSIEWLRLTPWWWHKMKTVKNGEQETTNLWKGNADIFQKISCFLSFCLTFIDDSRRYLTVTCISKGSLGNFFLKKKEKIMQWLFTHDWKFWYMHPFRIYLADSHGVPRAPCYLGQSVSQWCFRLLGFHI